MSECSHELGARTVTLPRDAERVQVMRIADIRRLIKPEHLKHVKHEKDADILGMVRNGVSYAAIGRVWDRSKTHIRWRALRGASQIMVTMKWAVVHRIHYLGRIRTADLSNPLGGRCRHIADETVSEGDVVYFDGYDVELV